MKTVVLGAFAALAGGAVGVLGLSIRYLLTGHHSRRFEDGPGGAVFAAAMTLAAFAVGAVLSACLVLRTVERPSATGGWKASSALVLILLVILAAMWLVGNL